MPDNEAPRSLDDVFERRRQEIADQKDPTRLQDPKRAKFASLKFGRPELVDEEGSVMVAGMAAQSKGLKASEPTAATNSAPAPALTSAESSGKRATTREFVEGKTSPVDEGQSAGKQAYNLPAPATEVVEQDVRPSDAGSSPEQTYALEAAEEVDLDEGDFNAWESSSEVQYPDGTKRLFEYDADGLFRVINPDGTVLQKCLDESWIEFDANGDLTDNSFPKEAVSVDAIGDFTHQKSDGSMLEHWSDGTKIETDIGGVSVTTNPDGSRAMLHWGRAYLVTHPNGGTRSFDYDEDGNLFKIHESQTGLAFEKQGDTWYKYLDVNEQGLSPENILDEFTGTVQVDVTGRVRIATAGKKTTIYPDGRWVNG